MVPQSKDRGVNNPARQSESIAASDHQTLTATALAAAASDHAAKLPQTGNGANSSLLGLGAASLASLLGLTGYKKKHDED